MTIRSIREYNCKNKKVLIRADFNVPLDHHDQITDDARIRKTIPTIRKVLDDGGIAIIVSHLGRPKNGYDPKLSLQKLVKFLATYLSAPVFFAHSCTGVATKEKTAKLHPGEVLLLENVRFHAEETTGDIVFAKALATLGDVYVNDSFGTIHRAHVSTTTIATYFKDKLAGLLLEEELANAQRIIASPTHPFVGIIGGKKLVDKIEPMQMLLDQVDQLLVGGGLVSPFLEACQYDTVSDIATEKSVVVRAKEIIDYARSKSCALLIPTDLVVASHFAKDATVRIVPSNGVPPNWLPLDIGPETRGIFSTTIQQAKTILWSGPIGVFEMVPFRKGTHAIAQAVAQATRNGAFSLIGGGDSAAAIQQLGYTSQVARIATGGSALLAYITNQNLLSLEVLKEK